jgi:hydroxymethylpyrimidine pyrophosphatase-like HAD family hydrolase
MRFAVGVDLHGTLIEDGEFVRPELMERLVLALMAAKGACRLFVCTGNDLSFVRRKVPSAVLALFDGMVLETGCVLSSGQDERVLVGPDVVGRMKELEGMLRAFGDGEVYKFDRRLASIAIFTRYGVSPAGYMPRVAGRVESLGYCGFAYTTHSSVAVDVVPRGFTKMTGLEAVAGGLRTVGVADSMNDLEMHLGSDYSFAPSNISPRLVERLRSEGRDVLPLPGAEDVVGGVTYVAGGSATEGVIQILEALAGM